MIIVFFYYFNELGEFLTETNKCISCEIKTQNCQLCEMDNGICIVNLIKSLFSNQECKIQLILNIDKTKCIEVSGCDNTKYVLNIKGTACINQCEFN